MHRIVIPLIIAVVMFVSGGIAGMDYQKTADFDRFTQRMVNGDILCFYDTRDGSKVYAIPHDENWKPMPRQKNQSVCGYCHEGQ